MAPLRRYGSRLTSNRSQLGCERGLWGEVVAGARKRDFKARDLAEVGAGWRPQRRAKTAPVPLIAPPTSGNSREFRNAEKYLKLNGLGWWSPIESNCEPLSDALDQFALINLLIQDEACEIVRALSRSCGSRGEHRLYDDSITFSRRRPNAIRSGTRRSNRSQFGCELSLCGVAPDGARKRNFEARDSGAFAARRPALRGAETGQNTDTYSPTRG